MEHDLLVSPMKSPVTVTVSPGNGSPLLMVVRTGGSNDGSPSVKRYALNEPMTPTNWASQWDMEHEQMVASSPVSERRLLLNSPRRLLAISESQCD